MIEERMNIDKIKFGKFIANRRRALPGSPTQKELAVILHVGTSAIGKIEAGETLPSFELFVDLADALQMTPGELMMVMVEREDGDKYHQEMNSWLYDKMSQVLQEYQALIMPVNLVQNPLLFQHKNQQAIDSIDLAKEQQKKRFPKKPPQDDPLPETEQSELS